MSRITDGFQPRVAPPRVGGTPHGGNGGAAASQTATHGEQVIPSTRVNNTARPQGARLQLATGSGQASSIDHFKATHRFVLGAGCNGATKVIDGGLKLGNARVDVMFSATDIASYKLEVANDPRKMNVTDFLKFRLQGPGDCPPDHAAVVWKDRDGVPTPLHRVATKPPLKIRSGSLRELEMAFQQLAGMSRVEPHEQTGAQRPARSMAPPLSSPADPGASGGSARPEPQLPPAPEQDVAMNNGAKGVDEVDEENRKHAGLVKARGTAHDKPPRPLSDKAAQWLADERRSLEGDRAYVTTAAEVLESSMDPELREICSKYFGGFMFNSLHSFKEGKESEFASEIRGNRRLAARFSAEIDVRLGRAEAKARSMVFEPALKKTANRKAPAALEPDGSRKTNRDLPSTAGRNASDAALPAWASFQPSVIERYVAPYPYEIFSHDQEMMRKVGEVLDAASATPSASPRLKGFRKHAVLGGKRFAYNVSRALLDKIELPTGWNVVSRSADHYARTKALKADAAAFCSKATLPPRPSMPALAPGADSRDVLSKMLAASRENGHGGGLVIGDYSHSHVAAKKLLVDNMHELRRSGVEVLFHEHLPAELHQADLDDYHRSPPGSPMPPGLENALDALNKGHMGAVSSARVAAWDRHNFLTVIETAKAAGIRVVAIDCEASYSIVPAKGDSSKERNEALNYLAAKAVQEYVGTPGSGAWIAFVGSAHANTCDGTVGLAELTGSLALHVVDGKAPVLEAGVRDEVNKLTPDAMLHVPPSSS